MRQPLRWQYLPPAAPAQLRQLITTQDSLTRKIEHLNGQRVSVEVRRNQLMLVGVDENQFIHVPIRHFVWVRDIVLSVADEPWVLARTTIPYQPRHPIYRQLSQFGAKPIGQWIFSQPKVKRSPLQYVCCSPETHDFFHIFSDITLPEKSVWGRRSRFTLQQLTFSVTEFFVPPSW